MSDRVERSVRALAILVGAACILALGSAGVAHAGPAPVGLGTASAFAVLAGSGMTNTGTSTIFGDVGSSPTGSQTGFGPCPAANCVDLTGTNHSNGAVTQQAKSDLITAYDDAFGRPAGAATPNPLGAGMTLVSGVYTSPDDIFVGGDLTLDGGGDPDAVFIFQAKTGTLKTAAGTTSGVPNTRVLLSNGAQACNVFWQVGSSATIGTFTQFVGNVLALQSITVNTSATLDTGRVLARNGAVTLDTNTIKKATCAGATDPGGSPDPGPTTPSDGDGDDGDDPTATDPPGAGPSNQALANSVRLRGPRRPVTGPFTVSVTGRRIESVTFFVDGKRRSRVHTRPGRKRFELRIDPRGQDMGMHTVKVRVRFRSRPKLTTTRRLTYRRASESLRTPRFTG